MILLRTENVYIIIGTKKRQGRCVIHRPNKATYCYTCTLVRSFSKWRRTYATNTTQLNTRASHLLTRVSQTDADYDVTTRATKGLNGQTEGRRRASSEVRSGVNTPLREFPDFCSQLMLVVASATIHTQHVPGRRPKY